MGRLSLTHSVSAGFDYALVGPEHAWLHDEKRAEYVCALMRGVGAAVRLAARRASSRRLRVGACGGGGVRRAPDANGCRFSS